MERDKLDFGTMKIGPLFRAMFFPTLIGMIFNSVITLIDGMFVGRGVGGNGIAAVNIVVPPWMIATGIGLMFIFPMDMGIRGAAWATMISCAIGAAMVLVYFIWITDKLKFYRLKTSRKSLLLSIRNVGYMMKIGFATFLTEIAMSVMIVTGNYMFMSRLGSQGVAAYAIACYLFPVVFSIANAVAQSAQPIISFNYGSQNQSRVNRALKIALYTAVLCGFIVTIGLWIGDRAVVSAFLSSEEPAYAIAVKGLPYFATCAVFFAVNITFIGYYQSIERAWQSIFYTLLRGIILIVPAFLVVPIILGDNGLWLAIPTAEFLTLIVIVTHFIIAHKHKS